MKKVKLSTKLLLIIATVAAPAVAFVVYRWQQQQAIEARYSTTLSELLRPRRDGEPNSSNSANLMKTLDEIIQEKSQGDETLRKNLRQDIAQRFAGVFKSHSFDFSQGTNVEFETIALANWPEYSDYLSANPKDNVWIMYQYSLALKSLSEKEPVVVESALPRSDGSMTYSGEPNDKNAPVLLQKLDAGYRMHVDLLRKSSGDVNREYLLNSFCWYHSATSNPSLTGYVFRYDDTQVRAEEIRCQENGQSVGEIVQLNLDSLSRNSSSGSTHQR
jgi:hypothetical protein